MASALSVGAKRELADLRERKPAQARASQSNEEREKGEGKAPSLFAHPSRLPPLVAAVADAAGCVLAFFVLSPPQVALRHGRARTRGDHFRTRRTSSSKSPVNQSAEELALKNESAAASVLSSPSRRSPSPSSPPPPPLRHTEDVRMCGLFTDRLRFLGNP